VQAKMVPELDPHSVAKAAQQRLTLPVVPTGAGLARGVTGVGPNLERRCLKLRAPLQKGV